MNLRVPWPVSRGPSQGFTLIELMMVSLLLTIIGGGLLTAFLSGQTSYLSADAYVQVQQEARKGFDNMIRELRESKPSTASPTMDNGNGAGSQLNLQIARGYNIAGCDTPPAICWGSEAANGQWVHYAVVGTSPNKQLVRCVNASEAGAITSGAGCRVLANKIKVPNSANSATFTFSAPDNSVTMNLEVELQNAVLPTGRQTTGVVTSRVRLRNP